jgi:hypothetical protein
MGGGALTLPEAPEAGDFPFDHVLRRTVVLPEHRVLFLPVPKAGCTTILHILADLAGLSADAFESSATAEVTASTAVHDMTRWGEAHSLGSLEPDERAAILAARDWFRFTVVRDPGPRLWSAWQSKLLLREPRFVELFGDRAWFPHIPEHADDLVEDFRRFVAALGEPDARDAHWCVQSDLVDLLPLNHVGRTEAMAETIAALKAHVGRLGLADRVDAANRALISSPPGLYDATAAKAVARHYGADYEAFGYTAPKASRASRAGWTAGVEVLLPAIRSLIERHDRIGQLSRIAQSRRVQEPAAPPKRQADAAPSNLEGLDDFAVNWGWDQGPLQEGFTAVVRVKNESRALPWVLPPLLRAVSRVVLVDNGSTDGTPDLAEEIAQTNGLGERLHVASYPFAVSRCGPEHLATPPSSVHSLTYFYNWAFSHVRTTYALKWDGDMIVTEPGVIALQSLAWQLASRQTIVTMNRHALYVADDSVAYLDLGITNREPWGWPNGPQFTHAKALDWELTVWPSETPTMRLPDWSCLELKFLDADEFAHWSEDVDFENTLRARRKRREQEMFRALATGAELPDGVVRIDAPADTHVIGYTRDTWLPEHRPTLGAIIRETRQRNRLAAAGR